MRHLTPRIVLQFLFSILLVLFAAPFLMAQDAPLDPTVQLAATVTSALILFGTPILVKLFKDFAPNVPKWSIPIVASLIGVGINALGSLAPGGKFAPVAAIGIVGIQALLRSFLGSLGEGAVEKGFAVFLALGIGFGSTGCASTASVQKGAYVGLVTSKAALDTIQDTLLITECEKPGAPPVPACVPHDAANRIHEVLAKAFRTHAQANDVAASIPDSIKGPSDPRVFALVTQIWSSIEEIRVLFPSSSPAEAMQAKVTKLQNDGQPRVTK